ncbi:hypothetical protein Hanom_Chr08g00710651 [Helianthus anomalus]
MSIDETWRLVCKLMLKLDGGVKGGCALNLDGPREQTIIVSDLLMLILSSVTFSYFWVLMGSLLGT